MYRFEAILLALLCAPLLVHAQDDPDAKRSQLLIREFRELTQDSLTPRHADQVRVLKELALVDHHSAVRYLIRVAEDSELVSLRRDVLVLLSRIKRDKLVISGLMNKHMQAADPYREIARGYLLNLATNTVDPDEEWLLGLFRTGTTEDRFLALEGLGKIGSTQTLDTALALAQDSEWKPVPKTRINCGTIIASVREIEGPRAARLLLMVERDRRFTEADAEVLRTTTSLWRERDLRKYISIVELADRDEDRRIDTATFLGLAGIDAARAPLLHVARNPRETSAVRAAAAHALGGLGLAKGDLARVLGEIAYDKDEIVRKGATLGLARLKVRQAAEQLVSMLDGPFEKEARAALARMTGLPADSDWKDWLKSPRCQLPEGT